MPRNQETGHLELGTRIQVKYQAKGMVDKKLGTVLAWNPDRKAYRVQIDCWRMEILLTDVEIEEVAIVLPKGDEV
jgi:hypothetical protein